MVAMNSLRSGSNKAISSPIVIAAAFSLDAESVTEMGQNVPSPRR